MSYCFKHYIVYLHHNVLVKTTEEISVLLSVSLCVGVCVPD